MLKDSLGAAVARSLPSTHVLTLLETRCILNSATQAGSVKGVSRLEPLISCMHEVPTQGILHLDSYVNTDHEEAPEERLLIIRLEGSKGNQIAMYGVILWKVTCLQA